MKRIITVALVLLLVSTAVTYTVAGSGVEIFVPSAGTDVFTYCFNYTSGAEEAIIFLHGLGGSFMHAGFLHHPDNPYMTISFDCPGHGRSGPAAEISWDSYVETVKAVMDAYGIKKASLVGHSLGADAAMVFAAKYPKSVKKVVLIDRAYYNYADVAAFNFTRPLMELMEYNPYSGLSYPDFISYMNLGYDTDISETWQIKEKVLLLAADPTLLLPDESSQQPTLPQIIAMIKTYPEMFGFAPEQAASLPDLTDGDIVNLAAFLDSQIETFASVNKKFDVIRTPFGHTMNISEDSRHQVRQYILDYLAEE